MKKRSGFLVSLSMALLLTACGGQAGGGSTANSSDAGAPKEQVIKIKFAHAAAETHPFHMATEKFAELVKTKTNDRVILTVFPSRQLGDDREILEQTMNGTLDAAAVSSAIFSGFTPVLDAVQMPFLINNYDLEAKVLKSPVTKELLDSLDGSLGLKGLTLFEGGMRHIANNKKKVETPADLKGLKLRVVPSDLIKDTFSSLGASPTPMAYGEIYSSLQTKVIDGEEINLTSIVSEKHYEVLKHVTLSGQFPFPAAVVFNSDVFNKLSAEDQKAIQEAADEAAVYVLEEVKKLDEDALKTLKQEGIEVTELQDNKEFLDITHAVYETYTAKNPLIGKFVDEVQKMK
ncbi:TRAP transporter substrate-binding protein [Brevibacillus ruminantium]|uniref:TRAP transporter substrate-binding protein n=1 Tax=Brevibacillus ruminantium TaxID=2950604 RepID=A0ABY4WBY3_9BACL|nr:TRAP transporter substrate-binding protein [Brevibacillus ruminantium]USG64692.1 TRAP transporter substrate-binding protein [Brevibacillus ruminantium]